MAQNFQKGRETIIQIDIFWLRKRKAIQNPQFTAAKNYQSKTFLIN